jgi:deazaflavin-dependent oxidoreductase (nitroreductase family)
VLGERQPATADPVNGVVVALLRSPLHRFVGRRLCLLRFRGRATGRIVELPVEYVRAGEEIVVLAGNGGHKTWWRNFRTAHRVDVLVDGHWYAGTGTVAAAGHAPRAAALDRYRVTHPRVPADTADPVVVIELGLRQADPARALRQRWFRNVTLGECAGFAVPATVGALTAHAANAVSVPLLVLAGAVEGALLGWFQARVLRSVLPAFPVARWVGATAVAAAGAWAIGMGLGLMGERIAGLPVAVLVSVVAVAGLALLLSIGTAQWTVLRGLVPRAGRWVTGTSLAWLVALGVFLLATTFLWQPGQTIATIAVIGMFGGLLMAGTVAALTGHVVVRVVGTTTEGRSTSPPRGTAPTRRRA